MIAPITADDPTPDVSIVFIGAPAHPAVDVLRALGRVVCVAAHDAPASVGRGDADLVVVDDGADAAGRETLAQMIALGSRATHVLLASRDAGDMDPSVAVLPMPFEPAALRAVSGIALRCAAARRAARDLEAENQRLRGVEIEATTPVDGADDLERYEGILTRSPAMRRTLALLRKIEGNDTTVLVHGETGTGKGLVAQAIHARSRLRHARFVAVNLGAISDHLRESELFGHVRGAFTGATDNRAGLFVEANGGTIFLDEVGDASPGLQVALLRVLEEGTITPVGSDRPRRVNVRVISGTNRNLDELVRQGHFRRDLYYRLNVFPVALPPLRDRPEDVVPLAKHFLARAAIAIGKKPPEISREARAVLEGYQWEGNVRELRNAMERAAILCKAGVVMAGDLPMSVDRRTHESRMPGAAATSITIPPGGAKLQHLEREIFLKTLAIAGDNQSRAARILGLRESTFRFRLQKLGIASRRQLAVTLGRVAMFAAAALAAASLGAGC